MILTITIHHKAVLNKLSFYEVNFQDGQVKEYAANVPVENILSQIDSEGFNTAKLLAKNYILARDYYLNNG